MRQNFGRNKRKIEETKKARREEKRIKRLSKPEDPTQAEFPQAEIQPPPEAPAQ